MIRQRAKLAKLEQLKRGQKHNGMRIKQKRQQTITDTTKITRSFSINNYHHLYHRFIVLYGEMLQLFDQIISFNRFWNGHITFYFIAYIIAICYLLYSYIFYAYQMNFSSLIFTIILSTHMAISLISITLLGSLLIVHNRRFHREGRRWLILLTGPILASYASSVTNSEAPRCNLNYLKVMFTVSCCYCCDALLSITK